MRYFFDLDVDGAQTRDDVGEEFRTVALMTHEASRSLTCIAADEAALGTSQEFRLTVRDSTGPVYELVLSLKATLLESTRS